MNHQELWEQIRDMKQERASFEEKEAPLTKIGSSLMGTSEQTKPKIEGKELEMDIASISKTLVALPSYLGHHDPGSKIIPLHVPRELP